MTVPASGGAPSGARRSLGAGLRRACGPVRHYVRAGPVTAAYLAVLVAGQVWRTRGGAGSGVGSAAWSSTNTENLAHHPVGALVTSLLYLDNTATLHPGVLLTAGLGVGGALWWLEAHRGRAVAAAAFLGGHVGATLLTALVITRAVDAGLYPEAVRQAVDVGVSYGAEAALAAVTWALPSWSAVAGALFVVGWPLADARWYGALPDFTTVGHLISAAIGFTVGLVAVRRHERGSPAA